MSDQSSNNKVHHYEEPCTLIRKTSITHFIDKYDKPVVNTLNSRHNSRGNSNNNNHSKMRSSKSMSSLPSNASKREELLHAGNLLDDCELSQVECFFRSHKTFVYVCRCMANLYFTKTDIVNGGRTSSPRSHEWELTRTGIPVIVFDKGETKSRSKRQLQICLAERGTGFILWKDIIDNLTDYKSLHPCFHTLYLSCDHRKMAGLSFDDADAAEMFLQNIETITSDPLNIALSIPKKGLKKEKSKSKASTHRQPRKCDISTPCFFQHITSVDLSDFGRLHSLSTLVPSPLATRELLRRSSSQIQPPIPSPVASTTSSVTSSENSSSHYST
ncbi:uncharacterized protein B4U79_07862 [Dinothrombium tinctorium]|uniref:WH1 domain-containing protein n=1 Tax=Dinothrombium tinctorium TaxID=1965070 RepID=A0A443RBG0_9ACAR|nr:uncharacterized protein B4U79_07862 [Dinothrombium tinctorium]